MGKTFSKPASSNLFAKDTRILQNNGDKLNRWAELFQEVVNCQTDIDVTHIEDLPIITLHSSSDSTLSNHDLSSPLSEKEIIYAISELTSGKVPGPDGVSLEMLSLGGEVTIPWLKSIFDTIWATVSVTEDWQSQILVPLHKKGSHTSSENYRCPTERP